jgi:hypothetical protein
MWFVKWSNCPASDFNRSKGKESYPSLAFQVITNYDQHILSVFGPQFGSQNDKHIVNLNPNVAAINDDYYSSMGWKYYDEKHIDCTERVLYLICNNGYLCSSILICTFMHSATNRRVEEYYSANLVSVHKDVECVFGIMKG